MPLPRSICAILLALSFLFDGARGVTPGRIVIGYRTVAEGEAEDINEDNKPYREALIDEARQKLNQLGNGLHIMREPVSWEGFPWWRNWYCVIEADINKIAKAHKIYIPEYYQQTDWDGQRSDVVLWHGGEDVIVDYITQGVPKDPGKALRFSWISDFDWELQMLIPTAVVNNDELDLWSECFETKDELKEYSSEVVDWESWGIAGDCGLPSLETFVPWIDDV
ncbi:uncharacterized protein L3040_001257 [Drepanopeziza brunnea f. sp. 'multigermtubi']|uniref:uncharacterized protein n=1 Tax=Drepanopeziza brunnea f. sp. 'multigermtubi' TaxID=698441 RepID=UPI002383E833|nr:hypothetical protein L3040_001257 [Drepanopeziza brunnea f. sp. 'multigermtubi']